MARQSRRVSADPARTLGARGSLATTASASAPAAARRGRSPEGHAATARCVFASLALANAATITRLQGLAGRHITAIHVVGGGSCNALRCQLTADAAGVPVVAGPIEATMLGNALVQLIALGELGTLAEARALVEEHSLGASRGERRGPAATKRASGKLRPAPTGRRTPSFPEARLTLGGSAAALQASPCCATMRPAAAT